MRLSTTVAEALDFADEWTRGTKLHEGSQGWRVVCFILAEEVRRLRTPQAEREAMEAGIDTFPAELEKKA